MTSNGTGSIERELYTFIPGKHLWNIIPENRMAGPSNPSFYIEREYLTSIVRRNIGSLPNNRWQRPYGVNSLDILSKTDKHLRPITDRRIYYGII